MKNIKIFALYVTLLLFIPLLIQPSQAKTCIPMATLYPASDIPGAGMFTPEAQEATFYTVKWVAIYAGLNGWTIPDIDPLSQHYYVTETNVYAAALGGYISKDNTVHVDKEGAIVLLITHGALEKFPNGEIHQYVIPEAQLGQIYDYQIYPYSKLARSLKYKGAWFVWMYACFSANLSIGGLYSSGRAYGFPFTWLVNSGLSKDGYTSPDGSGLCYLGFESPAPCLNVCIEQNGKGGDVELKLFVQYVYYALFLGYTVRNALNKVSKDIWGVSFGESRLHLGTYDKPVEFKDFRGLLVFGDSSIRLP